MADDRVDSATAARELSRQALLAILVGGVSGFATWLFIVVDHYGFVYLWETLPELAADIPTWAITVGVVALTTLLAAVVVVLSKGHPYDTGKAEAEYDDEGRIEYRNLLSGTSFALLSLFSGASLGPEAALTDINGGIGTFIAEKIRLKPEQVKLMAYAGVAGAFSAFFGAAPVGALLAAELISPKSLSISRTTIVAGLGAGATGWVVYAALGGQKIAPMIVFPGVTQLRLVDIGFAIVLGIVGGALGLVYGLGLMKTRVRLAAVRKRPWLAALAGGSVTAIAVLVSPRLLSSGQTQVEPLIADAASLGVVLLLGLGIAKLACNIWSLSTAYFGGPIFPVVFAGVCFGLAVNLLIPGIPQGVAVMALATGMVVSASVAPLSVTIFLALLADPELLSAIAVAAVAAFVVRQFLAPTLPGVYRATRAHEAEAAAQARVEAGPASA